MANEYLLPKKAVQAFKSIDEKIKALYEKREKMVESAISKFGKDCQGFIEVEGEEKPYCRVKIVDRLDEFTDKGILFTTAKASRYHIEISRLKNPPK